MSDVVQGPWIPTRQGPPSRRGPRRPAHIVGQGRAAQAITRASPWLFVGSIAAMWGGDIVRKGKDIFTGDWAADLQYAALERELLAAERETARRLKRLKQRLALQRAEEEAAFEREIEQAKLTRAYLPPKPPGDWLTKPYRKPLSLGVNIPMPYAVGRKAPQAIALPAVAPTPKTAWQRAITGLKRVAANPWAKLALGISVPALLAERSGRQRAPAPDDFPITAFEPEPSAYGVSAFSGIPESEFETDPAEARDERCEKITPRRSKGQCRQGWFSETPTELSLTEWSRRPCQ